MAQVSRCLLVFALFCYAEAHPNRGLDGEFYKELQQLLAQKSSTVVTQENENEHDFEPKGKPDVPEEVPDWPEVPLKIGQVSGVSVNSLGNPVIFHRGPRVWDQWSFNATDHFQLIEEGPIQENTIITLEAGKGEIIHEWGSGMFYMPHGLSMDRHDNYWVTDVALHQAFKFKPGHPEPILSFGIRFHPGITPRHLCKPTAVAVASTGEIFIADGYCNHRILKFNAAGGLLRIMPNPPEFLSLQVPHSLALMEHWDRVCVADRENMRVVCPRAGLYSKINEPSTALTIQEPDLGRVFAVAAKGNLIYAVNGPTSRMLSVNGFTIDPRAEKIIDHWSPKGGLKNPHAIAISPNGSHLYVAEIGPNKLWQFKMVPQKNVV